MEWHYTYIYFIRQPIQNMMIWTWTWIRMAGLLFNCFPKAICAFSAVQVEGNDLEHESHKGQRTQRCFSAGFPFLE